MLVWMGRGCRAGMMHVLCPLARRGPWGRRRSFGLGYLADVHVNGEGRKGRLLDGMFSLGAWVYAYWMESPLRTLLT